MLKQEFSVCELDFVPTRSFFDGAQIFRVWENIKGARFFCGQISVKKPTRKKVIDAYFGDV